MRWVALSGDPLDLRAIDDAVLERFADDSSVTNWITIAKEHVPLQGLPARTSWLDLNQRREFATMVNQMIAAGTLTAPVAMSRDHLDAGSVAQPTRETEDMIDGSDADRRLAGAQRAAQLRRRRRSRRAAPGRWERHGWLNLGRLHARHRRDRGNAATASTGCCVPIRGSASSATPMRGTRPRSSSCTATASGRRCSRHDRLTRRRLAHADGRHRHRWHVHRRIRQQR